MSDEIAASAAVSVLPEVDEVLAEALQAQGDAGVRALGLLRDARQVLAGAGLARPAEVAAACVRSAADALLKLGGDPKVGLKAAAQGLLAAVDAAPTLAAPRTARASGALAHSEPADVDVNRADAAGAGWEEVLEAAEVLRGELKDPGGYHLARARAVVERLMGVTVGGAQEKALAVWGTIYNAASGVLHGRGAGMEDAVALYTDVLAAARELLVPLPGRAARVLELAALEVPGAGEAKELAGWADPRASGYFFRSAPAPAWLAVLAEHAPHLLMPDAAAGGHWPAAPFLEHVTDTDPDAARAWLSAPAGKNTTAGGRAQQIAAAGRPAMDALLLLALRRWDIVDAGQMRAALALPGVRDGGGAPVGVTLRLAARWARSVPRTERGREWILAVEGLLVGAVEDEHAGHLALHAIVERVRAELQAAGPEGDDPHDADGTDAVAAAAWVDEDEMRELTVQQSAARLPDHDAAALLRELVRAAYPAGPDAAAHPQVTVIRAVIANLLRRDLELTPAAAHPIVFHADLDRVHVGDPAAYGGPRLARTTLDLAAADADAGVHLAERTRRFGRIADIAPHLHGRLLAAHLAHRPPADDDEPGELEWWQQALALAPQFLAERPAPEPARLVELVLTTCPPEHAAQLHADLRTALGTPPAADWVAEVLPAGADRVDGLAEPLASWLQVWDWSPVLPTAVLAGWEPVLDALRRIEPAGPSDPRAAAVLQPLKATTALDAEELAETAAEQGPVAAATALAGAEDSGASGYALVLHRLLAADPVAWTADVPGVLQALGRPELAAYYLAAAAAMTGRPGVLPRDALATAVAAALELRRGLGEPVPKVGPDGVRRWPAVLSFTDQALFDLLTRAWRTDTVLDADLEAAALDRLQALASDLTQQASEDDPGAESTATEQRTAARAARTMLGADPEVRALGCLLEYAAHRARTAGEVPQSVLDLVASVLTAHSGQDAVATAIGVHLPELHRHAPAFTAVHRRQLYGITPGQPSPAASWLRWGPYDRQLLLALDRAEFLTALRTATPGVAEHLAYALLADPTILGDPDALWADLAAGPGGADAASRLLTAIAARTPHAGGPLLPAAAAQVDAAVVLWRAALAAGLPVGALAGAGAFADAAVDDAVWLELTRASAEHSPPLTDADMVAERAAGYPGNEGALLLAAQLVAHPAGTWPDAAVRRHARLLLDSTTTLPQTARTASTQKLRTALVNAGDIDAAWT
ncbi:hypothetical protein [Streptomyces sp. NPDC004680]|uniref:hypothetical protein n=1 Tax=Streptomyces sp. NPDC004680 TaxID=3154287 RepID=UPI0033B4631E